MKKPRLLDLDQLSWIKRNIDKYPHNKELAKYFNITTKQIKDFLFTHGIRRSYTNKGRVIFNENFFGKYNALSCYWAGFIAADGCISTRKNQKDKFLTINLQIKDRIHLKNFIKHINGYRLKIIERNSTINNKIFKYCSVILYNNKIVSDLKNNFNIIERKTLKLQFPDIPIKYYLDFIRGYIDGDGCLSLHKDRQSIVLHLSFVGNESFIKRIGEIINKKYSFSIYKNDLCCIKYNFHNSIKACQKIYFPINKFCLDRKRKKYFDLIESITNIQKSRINKKGIVID
jgi:hypothetical protein